MAQLLLRGAGAGIRQHKFHVVLCEARLLNDLDDNSDVLDMTHGSPWVVLGEMPKEMSKCLSLTGNVYAVKSLLLQRRLKDRLVGLFSQNLIGNCQTSQPPTARCTTSETARESKGMKVLSVDDVPMNQQVMQRFLKRLGAQVHLANNGSEVCVGSSRI